MVLDCLANSSEAALTTCTELAVGLTSLDTKFENSRQLYKVHQLMLDVGTKTSDFVAVINNESEHCNFNLLAFGGLELEVFGIYDVVNKSIRLMWTTDSSFVSKIKSEDSTRYIFYRFPTLRNRPLFIHTQYVVSKLYKWSLVFDGRDSVLKLFNALENFLYGNPNQPEWIPVSK